ncbi:MAG: hypothetical protein LBP53_00980 [Candidatus Peribacteria bacterium]|jgi:hypothetical protein|nr:hypothetical protein [Candidatus Peribacteria bacterium]
MNFLSAVLVLVFGIGLVYQVVAFFTTPRSDKQEKADLLPSTAPTVGIGIGRSILLLRLTSGMGAFLVMVDNKTDLGVMALSLLALLAGMIFLGILNQQDKQDKKELIRYLCIAGIFFAFATLAKPTAFVDFALFGVFLIGIWISPWSAIGVGLGLAGVLRYMNVLTSSFLLSETNAKWLIIIGGILVVIGIIIALIKRKKI